MRSTISTLELSVFFFWDSIPSPSQWKKTWVFWDSEWRIKNIDSLRFSTFSAADLLLMRTPMVPSLRDSSKNTQKLRFCDSRFLNLTHLYSTHIFVWDEVTAAACYLALSCHVFCIFSQIYTLWLCFLKCSQESLSSSSVFALRYFITKVFDDFDWIRGSGGREMFRVPLVAR